MAEGRGDGWTVITRINATVSTTMAPPSSTGIHDRGNSTPARIAACTSRQRRTASTARTPPATVSAVPRPCRTPGNRKGGHQLNDGDATRDQCERGADPGQERPLVGEREAIVQLLVLAVDAMMPIS